MEIISRNPKTRINRKKDELLPEVVRLWNEGYFKEEIGIKLDIHANTVSRWLVEVWESQNTDEPLDEDAEKENYRRYLSKKAEHERSSISGIFGDYEKYDPNKAY